MTKKRIWQYDLAGRLVGETFADESPLEPGVFLKPARSTETPPPASWPEGTWPRWNGSSWAITGTSKPGSPAAPDDPVAKLQAFLAANPDVAAAIGGDPAA